MTFLCSRWNWFCFFFPCISLPHSFNHVSSWYLVILASCTTPDTRSESFAASCRHGRVFTALLKKKKTQNRTLSSLQTCLWPHSRWCIGAGKGARVCYVCRWVFGKGWIMTRLLSNRIFKILSYVLGGWMGFPGFLPCFEHGPSSLRQPDGQGWRRHTSSSSRVPMLWCCSGAPAMGLLHMGQTQRTSSHFTRHLPKDMKWDETLNKNIIKAAAELAESLVPSFLQEGTTASRPDRVSAPLQSIVLECSAMGETRYKRSFAKLPLKWDGVLKERWRRLGHSLPVKRMLTGQNSQFFFDPEVF